MKNTIEDPLKITATVTTNKILYNKQILHGDELELVDLEYALELRKSYSDLYDNERFKARTWMEKFEEQKRLTAHLAEVLQSCKIALDKYNESINHKKDG